MSNEAILARLARLEAESEIAKLKARYFHAGDIGDMAALRACFTDDAVIDFPDAGIKCGPDELHDMFAAQRAAIPGFFAHCGYNPRIEVIDDTRARADWDLCFVSLTADRTQQLVSFGCYHDEYRLTADGWRISQCRSTMRVAFAGHVPECTTVTGGDPT